MGDKTGISWTDATWNPLRGCTRVSEGCRHCYAEVVAARFSDPGMPYEGLAKRTPSGPRWTGKVLLVEKMLDQPLRWRKPRRIFVNSMSDLFHESVPDEWIDRIVAVMAQAHQHTYQVLTKRPGKMRAYSVGMSELDPRQRTLRLVASMYRDHPAEKLVTNSTDGAHIGELPWPLANVHLGVSVEDQATADERIPLLLQTPAAVRWVSYEPALGPVDFIRGGFSFLERLTSPSGQRYERLGWIVVGGESGPAARPFDLAWARSTVEQCRKAGVKVFFKQAGSRAFLDGTPLKLMDRKGGDLSELPAEFNVMEFP